MNPYLKITLFFLSLFIASYFILGCSVAPKVYRLHDLRHTWGEHHYGEIDFDD